MVWFFNWNELLMAIFSVCSFKFIRIISKFECTKWELKKKSGKNETDFMCIKWLCPKNELKLKYQNKCLSKCVRVHVLQQFLKTHSFSMSNGVVYLLKSVACRQTFDRHLKAKYMMSQRKTVSFHNYRSCWLDDDREFSKESVQQCD